MSTIPVPNGVRAEMVYIVGSQRVQNVYHFTRGAPATQAQLVTLFGLLTTWETNTGRTWRSSQCSLVLITLTALDGPGAPFYENVVNPAIIGASAAAPLANVLTLCAKHTTGLQGRSYRGRTYCVGLNSAFQVTPDTTSVANANLVAAMYNGLRTQLAAQGWTFCIASLYSGVQIINGRRRAIPRPSGILTPVIASSCEIGLDTQRHRKAPYQV